MQCKTILSHGGRCQNAVAADVEHVCHLHTADRRSADDYVDLTLRDAEPIWRAAQDAANIALRAKERRDAAKKRSDETDYSASYEVRGGVGMVTITPRGYAPRSTEVPWAHLLRLKHKQSQS